MLYEEYAFASAKLIDLEVTPWGVEVVAKGKIFRQSALYQKGTPQEGFETIDKELGEKFKGGVLGVLPWNKSSKVEQTVFELEKLEKCCSAYEDGYSIGVYFNLIS